MKGIDIMKQNLNKYIEEIITRYKNFDGAHDEEHAKIVISNSEYIANCMIQEENIEINMDMVRIIAAMHDLGLAYDRKTHHIKSGEIVRKEETLKEFFNDEQIEIIAKSVEEHRASYKGEYTSIYSMIVSDADRINDIYTMINRSYKYNKKHNPEFSEEELYHAVTDHLRDKYGSEGYARFNTKYADEQLKLTREILINEDEYDKIYSELFGMQWK